MVALYTYIVNICVFVVLRDVMMNYIKNHRNSIKAVTCR
jgi:hypothetical protein